MYESPFLRAMKNKLVPPDPSYLHEVEVLRAMLRQEDRQGDSGWGGSWTKERYQTPKEKHPEALMVFQTELRLEKERERHRRATFERLVPSAYIGQRTDTTVQRENTRRGVYMGAGISNKREDIKAK
jgi:hypothetical protein